LTIDVNQATINQSIILEAVYKIRISYYELMI